MHVPRVDGSDDPSDGTWTATRRVPVRLIVSEQVFWLAPGVPTPRTRGTATGTTTRTSRVVVGDRRRSITARPRVSKVSTPTVRPARARRTPGVGGAARTAGVGGAVRAPGGGGGVRGVGRALGQEGSGQGEAFVVGQRQGRGGSVVGCGLPRDAAARGGTIRSRHRPRPRPRRPAGQGSGRCPSSP